MRCRHYPRMSLGSYTGRGFDSLPLDDNTIDLVLFQEVIEHLYNSDLIMAEIGRVLKPNGLLILSTPNLSSID